MVSSLLFLVTCLSSVESMKSIYLWNVTDNYLLICDEGTGCRTGQSCLWWSTLSSYFSEIKRDRSPGGPRYGILLLCTILSLLMDSNNIPETDG